MVPTPELVDIGIVLGYNEIFEPTSSNIGCGPICLGPSFISVRHSNIIHVAIAPPRRDHHPFIERGAVSVVNIDCLWCRFLDPVVVASRVWLSSLEGP